MTNIATELEAVSRVRKERAWRRGVAYVVIALTSALTLLLMPGPAHATFSLYRLVTGGGQEKAFTPYAPPTSSNVTSGGNEQTIHSITSGSDVRIHVRVDIPDGDTIGWVTVYGDDNTQGQVATTRLMRSSYSSESFTTLATWTSSDTSNTWTSSAINHVVDTDNYAYWIEVNIPPRSDIRAWTAEIFH